MRLLWRAAALAVIAGSAGGDDIHPVVDAILGKRQDVLARQDFLTVLNTAIRADVAIPGEQLAVGQARLEVEGIDVGHALGANDAVDGDDRLLAGLGVMPAMEYGDLAPGLPAHLIRRVVDHGLLK